MHPEGERSEDRAESRIAAWYRGATPSLAARSRLLGAIDRGDLPRDAGSSWRFWALRAAAAATLFIAGAEAGRMRGTLEAAAARPYQIQFDAPSAFAVHIVGDFNKWSTGATPMDRDPGTGTWRATVPLEPGLHSYAFVVDRVTWSVDPRSPRARSGELGETNTLLVPGGQ